MFASLKIKSKGIESKEETQVVDFKPTEAFAVLQHEFAITTASSATPVLGSLGARPCLILALYDQKNKIAILAHIDALTRDDFLLDLLPYISTKNTVAYLTGGDQESKGFCNDILSSLLAMNIKIVLNDTPKNFDEVASIAIDSRTGKIYTSISDHDLGRALNFDIRMQFAALEFMKSRLRLAYNSMSKTNKSETFISENLMPSSKSESDTGSKITNILAEESFKREKNSHPFSDLLNFALLGKQEKSIEELTNRSESNMKLLKTPTQILPTL
ncbi:MAG: hypothetical protein ABI597_14050 [Gammaproteobacteria bacterium]